MIEALKKRNPQIKIFDSSSEEFTEYGRVILGYDFSPLLKYALSICAREEGVVYKRSVPELEALPLKTRIEQELYGEMPIQVGICFGYNNHMNGMEYHKGNEIIIAATDAALILGKLQDVRNSYYESRKARVVYLSANTAVELYSTTLHYAPINIHTEAFRTIIILPYMTNSPLDNIPDKEGENRLLFGKNKWFISHENTTEAEGGAYMGILGNNIEIKGLT